MTALPMTYKLPEPDQPTDPTDADKAAETLTSLPSC